MDKPEKSPDAFRTISEVSDQLNVPQHVLRFWEGKFPEVAPLKRAGNRRYYHPDHVALLERIRDLLYSDGYTTKGVQKLLQEGRLMEGAPTHPGALSPPTAASANLMDLTQGQRADRQRKDRKEGQDVDEYRAQRDPKEAKDAQDLEEEASAPPSASGATPQQVVVGGAVTEALDAIRTRLISARERLAAALKG